jgi:hypothetical protein
MKTICRQVVFIYSLFGHFRLFFAKKDLMHDAFACE